MLHCVAFCYSDKTCTFDRGATHISLYSTALNQRASVALRAKAQAKQRFLRCFACAHCVLRFICFVTRTVQGSQIPYRERPS